MAYFLDELSLLSQRIVVATPDKPFEYTLKGTLSRLKCLMLYKSEITDVYKHGENASLGPDSQFPDCILPRVLLELIPKLHVPVDFECYAFLT